MGLAEKLAQTRVRELNLREMPVADAAGTVRDVVPQLRESKLGCAVIVQDDKPVGMFTEGMLREAFGENPGVLDDPITDHVAMPFPRVYLDDSVDMVLAAMQANNTRFICVLDADENVVGLTGQKGLMEFVAEEFPRQVMVQNVGDVSTIHEREGA